MKMDLNSFTVSKSTYFGGSDWDRAYCILADSNYVYITGGTYSTNFPTLNAYDPDYNGGGAWGGDIFISKLNKSDFSCVQSTYFGGSSMEHAADAVLKDDTIILCGKGSSSTPIFSGYQSSHGGGTFDAYLLQFNFTSNTPMYSTFLGGGDYLGGNDYGTSVVLDEDGIIIAGHTENNDFPTVNPYQSSKGGTGYDGFLAKFSFDMSSLVYSTYHGGSDDDRGYQIEIYNDQVFFVGFAPGSGFPLMNPMISSYSGDRDNFLSVHNASTGNLLSSTYLGGSNLDQAERIVRNGTHLFVAGITESSDYSLYNAFQSSTGGGRDGFLMSFNVNSLYDKPPLIVEQELYTRFNITWPELFSNNVVRPNFIDLNNDGFLELLRSEASYQTSIYEWNNTEYIYRSSIPALFIDYGDYDGDGIKEILGIQDTAADYCFLNFTTDFLKFEVEFEWDHGFGRRGDARFGDLEHDGQMEIAYANDDGIRRVYSFNGSDFETNGSFDDMDYGDGIESCAMMDIDGDNKDEIFVGFGYGQAHNGDVFVYDDYSTGFSFIQQFDFERDPHPLRNDEFEDLNGDGLLDYVCGIENGAAFHNYIISYNSSSASYYSKKIYNRVDRFEHMYGVGKISPHDEFARLVAFYDPNDDKFTDTLDIFYWNETEADYYIEDSISLNQSINSRYKAHVEVRDLNNDGIDEIIWCGDDGNGYQATYFLFNNLGIAADKPMVNKDFIFGDFAFEFDGIDDYIEVKNVNQLPTGNNEFSISLWMFLQDYNGTNIYPITFWGTNDSGMGAVDHMTLFRTGNLNDDESLCHTFYGVSSSEDVYANIDLPDQEWFHACVTYDGSTIKIYYNGKLLISKDDDADIISSNIFIGQRNGVYYKGRMDDIQIYNKTLSPSEVNKTRDLIDLPVENMILYYNFEDTSINSSLDLSGIDNNGTLFGGEIVYESSLPTASFITNTSDISISEWIAFTDTTSGGNFPLTYEWDFGDGSINSSAQSPIHQYGSSGTFTVKLIVTDINGESSSYEIDIEVSMDSSLLASFTTNKDTIYEGGWIQFIDTTSGGVPPLTYEWDFGDGTANSSDKDPIHQYTTAGEYMIILQVYDNVSEHSYYTKNITVSNSDIFLNSSDLLIYYDFESNVEDGSIHSNDGINHGIDYVEGINGQAGYFDGSDYVRTPVYNYISNFTLSAMFKTNNFPYASYVGSPLIDSDEPSDYGTGIGIFDNQIRTIHNNGFDGDAYDFDTDTWYVLTAIFDRENNEIRTYINGSLIETSSVTYHSETIFDHFYIGHDPANNRYFNGLIDEVYIFNRTLSDSEVESLYYRSIGNPNILNASFSVNSTSIHLGEYIQFTDLTTGGIEPYIYEWDVGDNTFQGHIQNFTYYFENTGNYTVSLLVTDSNGDISFYSMEIRVIFDDKSPILNSPEDLTYVYGSVTDPEILWNAIDDFPLYYVIYLNDSEEDSGYWASDVPIIFDLAYFGPNIYEFEIYVYDENGNSASDEVIVTILSQDSTPPDDDNDDDDGKFTIPFASINSLVFMSGVVSVIVLLSVKKEIGNNL